MKIKTLWVFLASNLLLWAGVCQAQTSVVAVRTSAGIAIAADGLFTERHGTSSGCKIIILDSRRVFSFAGVAEFNSRNRSRPEGIAYNLTNLAKQAAEGGGSTKDVELRFRTRAIPLFREAFSQARGSSIPVDWYFAGGIETMFASIDAGGPFVLRTSYTFSWNVDGSPNITPTPDPCPSATDRDDTRCVSPLGMKDAVLARVSHFKESDLSDPARFARELVELEIVAAPEYVGPPISEVEMSATGIKWIRRGLCGPARANRTSQPGK
jgi:hypothetical protein